MTRVALLADVHGNLPALAAVQADLARLAVDHVVVAGDVVNWGPFSAQVLERVAGAGWTAIRGNNELYLVDYGTPRAPAEWSDRAQFSLLPWLQRQLDGRWRNAVAAWPDTLCLRYPDGPPLRVVHGAPGDHWRGLYPDLPDDRAEALLSGVVEPVVAAGHTHLPMDRRVGRWRIVNPGSVGLPLDGRHEASYALLEADGVGWRASFRRVPYDVAPVLEEFARQGFVEECGVIGRLIVEEFATARMHLVTFIHWRRACCPDAPLRLELFDEYRRADWLRYTPAPYRLDGRG